jgi:hypothetical protein
MQIHRCQCRFAGSYADSQHVYADSQVPMQIHRFLCRFTGANADSQVLMQIHRCLCRFTGAYTESQVMQIHRCLYRFTGVYADSQHVFANSQVPLQTHRYGIPMQTHRYGIPYQTHRYGIPMQTHRYLCRLTGTYTDSQGPIQTHRYLCRLTGTYANSQVSPYMRRGMYHPELAVAACVRRGLAVLRGLSLPVLPTMDDARGCLRHGLWQCHNLLPRLTHRCCLGLAAIHSHQLHRRHAHLVDAPIGGVAGGWGAVRC